MSILPVLISHLSNVISPRQRLREARYPKFGEESHFIPTYIKRPTKKVELDFHRPRLIFLKRCIQLVAPK